MSIGPSLRRHRLFSCSAPLTVGSRLPKACPDQPFPIPSLRALPKGPGHNTPLPNIALIRALCASKFARPLAVLRDFSTEPAIVSPSYPPPLSLRPLALPIAHLSISYVSLFWLFFATYLRSWPPILFFRPLSKKTVQNSTKLPRFDQRYLPLALRSPTTIRQQQPRNDRIGSLQTLHAKSR